ncbi:hypothetical protein SESBI_23531 [Sesbania bispinosa]|nr:hypothetical protein SESBI_23531 [Sesbania bispinosa]
MTRWSCDTANLRLAHGGAIPQRRERERRKEGRDGGAHSSGGATWPCLKVEEDPSRWLDGEDSSCEGEGRGSPARYRVFCGRLDDGGGDHLRWTRCSFELRELHSGDG